MNDDAALDTSLAALSHYVVGERTMAETLDRVIATSIEVIPGAAFAGITTMDRGKATTSAATHDETQHIDRAQYDSGEGPCLEALRTGDIVSIESTADDVRWPDFCRACVDQGVLSTLSMPLTVAQATHGALNLFATVERAFGPAHIRTAQLLAAQAAIVVANATAYWSARTRAEQLEEALKTRGVIEQAKGIIIATTRCTPDEAFANLVQQSQRQNVKLHTIAAEIVANAIRRPRPS